MDSTKNLGVPPYSQHTTAVLPPLDKEHEIFGYYWTPGHSRTVRAYDHSPIPLSSVDNVGTRLTSVSRLETLPPEIVGPILGHLDAASLTSTRRVSSIMNEFVITLPAFRNMALYIPSLLRVLSLTHCIQHHSVAQLHRAMRSSRCEFCHRYGRFLHLLQCSRCCYNCLTRDFRLISLPMGSAAWALEAAGLEGNPETTRNLYSAWITEGNEFPDMTRPDTKRFWLTSWEEVLSILKKNGKSTTRFKKDGHMYGGSLMYFLQQLCFHGTFALPYFHSSNDGEKSLDAQYGILCRGCEWKMHLANNDSVTFLSEEREAIIRLANTAYSKAEFSEHLETCHNVQTLREKDYETIAHLPKWPASYGIKHLADKRS